MKRKILTIMNVESLSYVLTTVLKRDFNIIPATNYAEGFNLLRSETQIDLIIIHVPNEASENVLFLAHLSSSRLFDEIPVVILSDSAENRLRNKIKAPRAALFVSTPFDPLSLADRIKGLVYEKAGLAMTEVLQ